MSITRDEVAHLARLSRLALTDAELDHFAGQLDQIIGAVARVQEVAAEGIPPMTHAVPVVNVFRDDVEVPCLTPSRCCPRRRRPSRAGSGSRGSWRRTDMAGEPTGLTQLTAAQIAAAVAAGEVSAVEVTRAHLDRIAAVDPDVHAFLHVAGDGALAAAADVDRKRARGRAARSAGRRAAGAQGRHDHHGHADYLRVEDPARAGGRPTTRR